MFNKLLISFFVLLLFTVGCTDPPDEFEAIFGDFTLSLDRTAARFDGLITANSLAELEEMVGFYTDIERLDLINATGDPAESFAFDMGDILQAKNISTNITDEGKVEGAGAYLFLGGSAKSIAGDGKIGVRSWATSSGEEASQLAMNDSQHEVHIAYLKRMGFSDADAKAFYFFSLDSAPSNEIYYLTDQDVLEFKLLN